MPTKKKLYKYRDFKGNGFKYSLDIILNERLHASNFQKLRDGNDEKEGAYYHQITNESIRKIFEKEVLDQKSRFNICCLSNDNKNDKMWEEYADNYKGVINF